MLNQVTSSALAALDEQTRLQELDSLIAHTKSANGSAGAYLRGRIAQFEERYAISSVELRAALRAGTQTETADVAEWLFLLETLKLHNG